MKNMFLVLGAAALLTGWPIPRPPLAEDSSLPIARFQSAGWRIVEKREETKQLPGLPPYENLTRVVQVVHYRLEQGDGVMRCTAEHDTQRDHYTETCRPGSR